MNAKKTKTKERRRAKKLAEQAWEAAHEENLDLAEKLIRRAVATRSDNPVLWNEQGLLLNLRGKEADAEDAFRAAISLAPTFAEPYANLAALSMKNGYPREAVRLMTLAVEHESGNPGYVSRLEAYRALLPPDLESRPDPAISIPALPSDEKLSHRLASLDWQRIGDAMTRDGCVVLPGLMEPDRRLELQMMMDDPARFSKTVVMDSDDFGKGSYRYFQAPIPGMVDVLRREVYPFVARIANRWQQLLNEAELFPENWESFCRICHQAGQMMPTPILIEYGPGGFNALHRDLRGEVFFPIQMAVVLSPHVEQADAGSERFEGGNFLFCDVPERKKSRRRELAAGLGDAVLFCTRDRLVRVGDVYGLQPVKHGVTPITAGRRVVLGVPFHEYR